MKPKFWFLENHYHLDVPIFQISTVYKDLIKQTNKRHFAWAQFNCSKLTIYQSLKSITDNLFQLLLGSKVVGVTTLPLTTVCRSLMETSIAPEETPKENIYTQLFKPQSKFIPNYWYLEAISLSQKNYFSNISDLRYKGYKWKMSKLYWYKRVSYLPGPSCSKHL